MLSRDYFYPFMESFVRDHGVDAYFSSFFDKDGDPLPSAPQEMRDEVAAMRGDDELLERYHVDPGLATA